MEDLIRIGLDAAVVSPVVYADVRVDAPRRYEHLAVQNGEANSLTETVRSGVGIRTRTKRAWGFATVSELSPIGVRQAARSARRAALAAEQWARAPLRVTPEPPAHGIYETTLKIDPFSVDREEKLAVLLEAEKALHVSPSIKNGHASFQCWEERKYFGSSEGSSFRSRIVHVGAGVHANAAAHGEVQRRSGPTSFGGDYRQGGWEYIQSLRLNEIARQIGQEAVDLLTAPACPTGRSTLVLGTDQLALQVHESVGHATELDRILGTEAGFAGTSFVRLADVGKLQYGSAQMNIVANAKESGGLGTFGWDDEGVRARKSFLIREGTLVGVLSSRENAFQIGLPRSGGTARAEGFHRAPLVRMTNIDLLPGDYSFEELLEGVREGIFMATNRSWSIDDKRLNFQFGTEIGRKIVRGELTGLVRNPVYSGITPNFWQSMDAAGDASTWHLWGVPNCGKGQPGQVARVGHGAPAARFRSVEIRSG